MSRRGSAFLRFAARGRRGEDGFTIIELMIASGIMATALALLAGTVTSSLVATGVARERDSGNALANQTMEQIRALPLNEVKLGLNATDIASDPALTTCGTAKCYGNETVVAQQTVQDSPPSPLYPHIQTQTVGPTTFTIATYLTNYQNDPTTSAYRVTVLVTWTPIGKSARGQTQAETILHYPTGCLSTATRPFSGPCLASFATDGQVPTGSVHVEPHPESAGISGISLDHADMWLPKATADLRVEQIVVAEASVQSSGGEIQQTDSDPSDAAIQTAGSAANNDPDQPGSMYSTLSPPTQTPATASLSGGGNSLSAGVTSGGDTGATTATTSASTTSSPTRNCPNLSGLTNKTDSLPCASASMKQMSTANITLAMQAGSTDMGNAILASSGPQSAPSTAVTERLTTGASPKCTTTSGDGCARVTVTRGAQTINIGGLPANVTAAPGNWAGYYVQLSGYTETATAEAGTGTSAPSAAVNAGGQVKYFDSNGNYTTKTISSDGSFSGVTGDITVPTLTINDSAHQVVITLSGTIHRGDETIVHDPANCGSGCTRTKADANPAPITIDVEYTMSHAGSVIADLDLHLDPGTLLAGASYAQAPTS